jgi:hypothetical protein
MKYEKIKNYKDEEFRRLSWVKRSTFKKMIEILADAENKKKNKRWEAKFATNGRKAIDGVGILKRVSNILPCSFFIRNIGQ